MIARSTLVVHGPLAIRMQRLAAAREGNIGREILTLPLVAARLAGGFLAPASRDVLYPAIQTALAAGGFYDLGRVSSLPGMPRAVLQALDAVWRADIDLSSLPQHVGRFADLHLLETRIRELLPASRKLPRDLRDAAMSRVSVSKTLLGPVILNGIVEIDAVWRPLLNEIARFTELSWDSPVQSDNAWFKGTLRGRTTVGPAKFSAEASADPKSEVVESLRWVRQLLASGQAKAEEIAVAATSTLDWDDYFLAYANNAGLPLHFSDGVPALSTPEGQACAALADILTNGLSQERVWRLFRRLPARPFMSTLPEDWFSSIPRSAGLKTLDQWREALIVGRSHRAAGVLAETMLLPILDLLARGPNIGREAGSAAPAWPCGRKHHEARRPTQSRSPCRHCGYVMGEIRRIALFGVPRRTWPRARDHLSVCSV